MEQQSRMACTSFSPAGLFCKLAGPTRLSADRDVVLDRGCAGRCPRSRRGDFPVAPGVHYPGKPNIAAVGGHGHCLWIEEPRPVQSVHDVIADIRCIDLRLDGGVIRNAHYTKQPANILFRSIFLIPPVDLSSQGDPAFFDRDLNGVRRN